MSNSKRVFIKTDDRCAICGWQRIEDLTVHHIDHDAKNAVYENEIVLCWNCHKRHHDDGALTSEKIRERKRTLIHRTLTQYGVNALKEAYRRGDGMVGMPFLLNHLVDMGLLEKMETVWHYGEIPGSTRFEITKRGRRFHDRWLR